MFKPLASSNDQPNCRARTFAPGRRIRGRPLPTCTASTRPALGSTGGCSTAGSWRGKRNASSNAGRCAGIRTIRAPCVSPAAPRAASAWCDPSSTGERKTLPAARSRQDRPGSSKGSRSRREAHGHWSSMRAAPSYRGGRKAAADSVQSQPLQSETGLGRGAAPPIADAWGRGDRRRWLHHTPPTKASAKV